jgi:hypothetical protein
MQRIQFAAILIAFLLSFPTSAQIITDHPRLYFTKSELQELRVAKDKCARKIILENMLESARWCVDRPLRKEWIPSVADDPIYENLYDRFYGMMQDMATTEHLAFTAAYTADPCFINAARKWTLSDASVWAREADGEPNVPTSAGGVQVDLSTRYQFKAYSVSRLVKGMATAYDILYDDLTPQERTIIRNSLVNITSKYYKWYLNEPNMGQEGQDPHHASVETASFGIVALALLGEVPDAQKWLDLIVAKHRNYLLLRTLTINGTQQTGSSFWVSTMFYRMMFMDALKRVTGEDLFKEYSKNMRAEIAFAAIAGQNDQEWGETNRSVLLCPSYAQLDYWSPILLGLARQYRDCGCQYLGLWDKRIGSIQKVRYVTPNKGEQLLFAQGGYAYAWYDPVVQARVKECIPRSFKFPEVNEMYVRQGYNKGDFVIAMSKNDYPNQSVVVVIHAGNDAIVNTINVPDTNSVYELADDGNTAVIKGIAGVHSRAFIERLVLDRKTEKITAELRTAKPFSFWSHCVPLNDGNSLRWADNVSLKVCLGRITAVDPNGYSDQPQVTLKKQKFLQFRDPHPFTYPLTTITPDGERIILEIARAPVK